VENLHGVIYSLKVYILKLEVNVGIRFDEVNLEDINLKCANSHSIVMKEQNSRINYSRYPKILPKMRNMN